MEAELKSQHDVHRADGISDFREMNNGKYQDVVAGPKVKKVNRREDVGLVSLPHVALSSKLHWDEYPDYLGEDISKIIESTVKGRN